MGKLNKTFFRTETRLDDSGKVSSIRLYLHISLNNPENKDNELFIDLPIGVIYHTGFAFNNAAECDLDRWYKGYKTSEEAWAGLIDHVCDVLENLSVTLIEQASGNSINFPPLKKFD